MRQTYYECCKCGCAMTYPHMNKGKCADCGHYIKISCCKLKEAISEVE